MLNDFAQKLLENVSHNVTVVNNKKDFLFPIHFQNALFFRFISCQYLWSLKGKSEIHAIIQATKDESEMKCQSVSVSLRVCWERERESKGTSVLEMQQINKNGQMDNNKKWQKEWKEHYPQPNGDTVAGKQKQPDNGKFCILL